MKWMAGPRLPSSGLRKFFNSFINHNNQATFMPSELSVKSLLIHVLIILVVSVSLQLVYQHWLTKKVPSVEEVFSPTHVSCHGINNTDRRCKFRNLCFRPDTQDFVFFRDSKSILSGVPEDRFNPTLLDLSSVRDHNRYFFNYIEVPFPRFSDLHKDFKVMTVKKATVIFGRFKPDNLMHLLHDDLFPLLATIEELALDKHNFNVFFYDEWHDFFDYPHLQFARQLYHRLVRAHHYFSKEQFNLNTLVCFKEAHVGLVKSTTWYDYGFWQPQGPLPMRGQDVALPQLTNVIKDDLELDNIECSSNPIVFLSRKKNRLLLNEPQLMKAISSMTKYEIPVINLRMEGFNNFTQLVSKIWCAKVLIGVHGSVLALSNFLPKGSGVIELFPYAVDPESYTPYKTLCSLLKIPYRSWANRIKENTVIHPEYPKNLGGINHLTSAQIKEIMESDKVRPRKCCDDPEWLFRINQDTIVDIPSFMATLSDLILELSTLESNATTKVIFAPGRVQSIICSRDATQIALKWKEPWNLEFMSLEVNDLQAIKYEILVQSRSSDERLHLFSKEPRTYFNVNGSHSLIWIRCRLHNAIGPFNTEPVHC